MKADVWQNEAKKLIYCVVEAHSKGTKKGCSIIRECLYDGFGLPKALTNYCRY